MDEKQFLDFARKFLSISNVPWQIYNVENVDGTLKFAPERLASWAFSNSICNAHQRYSVNFILWVYNPDVIWKPLSTKIDFDPEDEHQEWSTEELRLFKEWNIERPHHAKPISELIKKKLL